MNDTAWRVLSAIQVGLAVLIVIASCLFGECPEQIETAAGGFVPMKCHWTFLACDLMAAVALVQGVLLLTAKEKEAKRKVAIGCLAIFVAIILAANFVLGVCSGDMSECRTTAAVITALSAAGIVAALVQIAKPVANRLPKARL